MTRKNAPDALTARDCHLRACSAGRPFDWPPERSLVPYGLPGKTRLVLVGLLALHIGCGGGVDGSPIPPPTTPEPAPPPVPPPTTPEPAPPPVPPPPAEDLIVPPAEAGKVAPDRIALTLTSVAGEPLPDTAYEWTTDEHSGWVFPAEGRSDDEGRIDAAWVPGFPGEGELNLEFVEGGGKKELLSSRRSARRLRSPRTPPSTQHSARRGRRATPST